MEENYDLQNLENLLDTVSGSNLSKQNNDLIQTLKSIKRKKDVEIYFEKRSKLENINTALVGLDFALKQFTSYSSFAEIAVTEALISSNTLEHVTKTTECALQILPIVSLACKISYLAYDYFKRLEEESARITYYNMIKWCEINLQLKNDPIKFEDTISPSLRFLNKLGMVSDKEIHIMEIENLKKGNIKNFEEAYYGIMAFIFGNFIYSIDGILDSFVNDNEEYNKKHNLYQADKQRIYSIKKFQERKKELCYDKMIHLFTYIARHQEFPTDYIGQLNPYQIQKINEILKQVPTKEFEYVQGSIFCFLFKTLECAVENLKAGLYNITNQDRQKLMVYFRKKNEEYFDSWHEYEIYTSASKAHYFRIKPEFQKHYIKTCHDLCNLIEKKKQKVANIENQNKINSQNPDKFFDSFSEYLGSQSSSFVSVAKDLEKIKVLNTCLKENIHSFKRMQAIESKRLISFNSFHNKGKSGYDFFVEFFQQDKVNQHLLHFAEYKKYNEIVNIMYKPNFYFDLHSFQNEKIKYKNLQTESIFVMGKKVIKCYDLSFRSSVAGEAIQPHVREPSPMVILIPVSLVGIAILFPIPIIADTVEKQTLKYVRTTLTENFLTRTKKVIKKTDDFLVKRETYNEPTI